jgi:DNA repair exonuclease SbcCD nuclease subunit
MKILNLADTHITARTPSSRLDDIQETIKLKFAEIGVVVRQEKIDVIVHSGDMFHRPEVANKFVGEIAEIIRSYNVPFYVVPGNHDLQGQNEESLPHTKLGLLASAGVIKILNRKNPITFNDNGFVISIEGQEYYPDIDKNPIKDYMVYNQTADYKMLVAHSMLLEKEYFENVPHTVIKDVVTDADMILSGHYHPGHGVVVEKGVTYVNPGSLLRVEGSTHSIKAKPQVAILDISSQGQSVSLYELKVAKEGKEVFSSANLQKKNYNATLENFNSKLKNIKLDSVNIVSLIDEYVKTHPEDANVVKKAKDEIIKVQREQVIDNGFIPAKQNVYITGVHLKNFQTHEDLKVSFVNGLNSITGESNVGKTAILRGIYWTFYDKPSGSAFITTGKKSCSSTVFLSNGYAVERKRTKSSAGTLKLIHPDGTEQDFKGFANNIPMDVINAHQMPEIKIGGNTYRLNIASQLEGPFLVCSSSTERMAMIGALVDADRADEARKVVNSEKRALSAELKKTEERKELEVAKLDKYANLDKTRVSVETLEMVDSKLDSDELLLGVMEGIRNDYSQQQYTLTNIETRLNSMVIPDTNDIEAYMKELDEYEKSSNLLNELVSLYSEYQEINDKLFLLPQAVDKDDILMFQKELTRVEYLVNLLNEYNDLVTLGDGFSAALSSLPKSVSQEDIETYKQLVNEYIGMVNLSAEYNNLSQQKFDFHYDLETLKSSRDEYVNLIKDLTSMINLVNEFNAVTDTMNDIDNGIDNCTMNIDQLKHDKMVRLDMLKDVAHICETCGSEVSADKLLNH